MAIVRCEKHPVNLTRATNIYVKRVKPVGYPVTAAICGTHSCEEPGIIWLTDEEFDAYRQGERFFRVKTYTVKVRASDNILSLP